MSDWRDSDRPDGSERLVRRDVDFGALTADLHKAVEAANSEALADIAGSLAAIGDLPALREALATLSTSLSRSFKTASDDVWLAQIEFATEALDSAAAYVATAASQALDLHAARTVRERVAEVLAASSPRRTSEIAELLEVSTPQVSKALRELANSGAAAPIESPPGADGRSRFWTETSRRASPYAFAARGLTTGVRSAGRTRNDLLPLGPADRVDADVMAYFASEVAKMIRRGTYKPTPATIFHVPKHNDLTRPASLLRLDDRVVYQSLTLTASVGESGFLDPALLWPTRPSWDEFERLPLTDGRSRDDGYVVVADIASFYDTVDHDLLSSELTRQSHNADAGRALTTFLSVVMGRRMGLPQGLKSSDPLADIALRPIDRALQEHNLDYVRHGDDFRISCSSRTEARAAIEVLDASLREARFHLNYAKTQAVRYADYERNVEQRDEDRRSVLEQLDLPSTARWMLATREERYSEANDPGVDEDGRMPLTNFAAFVRAARAQLRERVEEYEYGPYSTRDEVEDPEFDAALFEEALTDAAKKASDLVRASADALLRGGLTRWEENAVAGRFSDMLDVVAAAGHPLGTAEWWTTYLDERPQDTRRVSRYLAALAHYETSDLALDVVQRSISEDNHSDTQMAWLISAAAHCVHGTDELAPMMFSLVERAPWLTRLGAASWLKQRDLLGQRHLESLWSDAPLALRSDLAALLSRSTVDEPFEAVESGLTDAERVLVLAN